MKKTPSYLLMIVLLSTVLVGCEAAGELIKKGTSTGIFIVIAMALLIIFLIVRSLKKKK